MQPIGPLMHEHRLIERMIGIIQKHADAIQKGAKPDYKLIADAVEFFRVYADQCHHGKEEALLFKELSNKGISKDLSAMMNQLIQEHKQGRRMVGALHEANLAFLDSGGDVGEVIQLLNDLASFYPEHIAREDKHFFFPVMEYFSREEMDRMLDDFNKFDQEMIHNLFREKVRRWEESA